MNKAVLGLLAAGVLAVPAPSASASHPTVRGDCFFDTQSQEVVTGGRYEGVMGVYAVVRDEAGAPASATIGCKIQISGSDAPGTTHFYDGFGVVAGADQITLVIRDIDVVTMCHNVDGGAWECRATGQLPFPPQGVTDLLNDEVLPLVDATACPVLARAAGTYGPVTIGADGDVSDPEGKVSDCPPYDR